MPGLELTCETAGGCDRLKFIRFKNLRTVYKVVRGDKSMYRSEIVLDVGAHDGNLGDIVQLKL